MPHLGLDPGTHMYVQQVIFFPDISARQGILHAKRSSTPGLFLAGRQSHIRILKPSNFCMLIHYQ